MLFLRSFQRLWLCFLYGLFILPYVRTAWPSMDNSGIQFLGLFPVTTNVTQPFPWDTQSRAMFKTAIMLSRQYGITIQGQSINWQTRETDSVNSMNALDVTCQVMTFTNITGVVGPGYTIEALTYAPFASRLGIPIVSYSATAPQLSDGTAYPAFFRTVPSDTTATLAVTQLFLKFNWTAAILIYSNDAYGTGGAQAVRTNFASKKLTINQTIIFDLAINNTQGDLRSLLTGSTTRIVILWMQADSARLVLQSAIDLNVLGPQFLWILSDEVSLDKFNTTSLDKLIGMIYIAPSVGAAVGASTDTSLFDAACRIWQQYEPESFPGKDNVDVYALYTFDATWVLVQALKQLCATTTDSSCLSFNNEPFCFDRRFVNSKQFLNAIFNTPFLGITGPIKFSVVKNDRIDGNYYIAKNVQRSSTGLKYISGLIWSDSGEWNTNTQTQAIIWPDNSAKVPSGYAVVTNAILRVAIVLEAPFAMNTTVTDRYGVKSTNVVGYILDLINQLKSILGFVPVITFFPDGQSYDELINAVANGTFDMFAGDVTITPERSQKVSFSNSIFDNSLSVITRDTSSSKLVFFSFMRPFSVKLWITLLFATILAIILVCLLERQNNEALQDRSFFSLTGMSIWYTFGTLMRYGADFHTATIPGRIVTGSLYILSVVLIATYTANLATDLTVTKSKGVISGIDDIKSGKLSYSRIGIVLNSSIVDYYLSDVSGGSKNFYPLNSVDAIYSSLLNNTIDASIMDSGTLQYAVNHIYCNLTVVGSNFEPSSFGIAFQKNWLFQQDFDVALLSLAENGTLDDLRLKWFEKGICGGSTNVPSALEVKSMAGLFIIFGIISVISILFFLWRKRFFVTHRISELFR